MEPRKQDLDALEANPLMTNTEWEEERSPYTEWDAGDEEYDRRRDEMVDERRREREA